MSLLNGGTIEAESERGGRARGVSKARGVGICITRCVAVTGGITSGCCISGGISGVEFNVKVSRLWLTIDKELEVAE